MPTRHEVYPADPKVTRSEKASVVSWDVALFSMTSLLPHRQDKASTRSTPLQKSGKKSLVKEGRLLSKAARDWVSRAGAPTPVRCSWEHAGDAPTPPRLFFPWVEMAGRDGI